MAYFGKEFKYEKQENFEDFVKALGVPADKAQAVLSHRPPFKITKDGDSYTMTSPETESNVTFKSGVPFDAKVAGVPCKVTMTVDGDTVTRVQKYDDGNVVTIVRKFSGNEMVSTVTTSKWDGAAQRYYKA